MFEGLTFFEVVMKGGVAVYVLAVFSVASLAVVFERLWTFRAFSAASRSSLVSLRGSVAARALDEAPASALVRVLVAGRCAAAAGAGRREEVLRNMGLALRAESASLQGALGILGTIGATAPFIGLFGTVIGIIRAFSDMAVDASAGPLAVADGIAEALVATAAGLFVAIPAVIAYNYFIRRARRLTLELEQMASGFVPEISGGGGGGDGL